MKVRQGWETTVAAVLFSAVLGISVSCSADHTATEHPTSEHPSSESPAVEHPQSSSEHPEAANPQEHPESGNPQEHPETESGQEHPSAREREPVTKERLADAITNYVTQDMRLKGNYFLFYDAKKDEVLTLKLDHVHRERVAQTADNRYFVCADFRHVQPGQKQEAMRSEEGKLYDLDFWMKRGDDGKLHVTEITLHKESGEPRYTWHQEDGTWKRKKME